MKTRTAEPREHPNAGVALVESSFRHEALFYSGEEGFLRGTLPFVTEGLQADGPVLVALGEQRAELLKHALGEDLERVRFISAQVLENPARAISAWCELLAAEGQEGRRIRGICETAWLGRSAAELDECRRHEELLGDAFADGSALHLLCPYDLDALDAQAIAAARRT